MSTTAIHTLTYTNSTKQRRLIIVEPWALEYWIEPDEKVEIHAHGLDQEVGIDHSDVRIDPMGGEGVRVHLHLARWKGARTHEWATPDRPHRMTNEGSALTPPSRQMEMY